MDDRERGQVTRSAAGIYHEFFVPALFGRWTDRIANAADVQKGQHALDVACGTGILARELDNRTGTNGRVCGIDINREMLDIARAISPKIDWREAAAESLPFEDASFDRVVSQFGLMFFEDRGQSMREIRRVLKPDGRVVVAVWGPLSKSPGYAAMYALLRRLFGDEIAAALNAPFVLGERHTFLTELRKSGIEDWSIETAIEDVCFPSLHDWLHTEIRGWTLSNTIDDDGFARFEQEANAELAPFENPQKSVVFPIQALIATAKTIN